MLATPITIGSLTLPNRVFLAPLAGVSDVPFRRVCQEMGAGLTFVEMLNGTAVNYRNARTLEMMSRHPDEKVLGVQVTGPTAEGVAQSVQALCEAGFDLIDLNMGCPVRKIISSGLGCAFLKDPERVSDTVSRAREATSKPLTVKTRLGFAQDAAPIVEIAERIGRAGADMMTIHGRFRTDDYSVRVRFEGIASGFQRVREAAVRPIATVGNGDVMDLVSAQRMVEKTGCDAVMISRGALGNPWIFREILSGARVVPTLQEWLDVTLHHIDYHEEFYGDNNLSARQLRKHLIWYSSGFPRCNRLRNQCNTIESLAEARAAVKDYATQYPKDTIRYENPDAAVHGPDPKYHMDRTLDRGVGDDGLAA
jgi:nifR3 family TIM-barrel protein